MRRGRHILLLAGAVLALAGCAGSIRTRNSSYSPTMGERFDQVVNQPLADFNLSNVEIPQILKDAAANPYAPPARPDCAGLKAETDSITEVLGPDVDPVRFDRNGSILDADRAREAAWGTARGAAEGWIPFHGVVKELTGAANRDRLVNRAILAGFVRRAYLRGLSASACMQKADGHG